MKNIVIAHHHPVVQEGLHTMLADIAKEIYSVWNENEAIKKVFATSPSVLILGCNLPNAIQVVETLKQHMLKTNILVYSPCGELQCLYKMVQRGVTGYALQTEPKETLLRAIELVSNSKPWYSPCLIPKLISMNNNAFPEFTRSEWGVLHRVLKGQSNHTIAVQLCLNEQVVKNYTSRIYKKLGVRSRAEAIVKASQMGLLNPDGQPTQ